MKQYLTLFLVLCCAVATQAQKVNFNALSDAWFLGKKEEAQNQYEKILKDPHPDLDRVRAFLTLSRIHLSQYQYDQAQGLPLELSAGKEKLSQIAKAIVALQIHQQRRMNEAYDQELKTIQEFFSAEIAKNDPQRLIKGYLLIELADVLNKTSKRDLALSYGQQITTAFPEREGELYERILQFQFNLKSTENSWDVAEYNRLNQELERIASRGSMPIHLEHLWYNSRFSEGTLSRDTNKLKKALQYREAYIRKTFGENSLEMGTVYHDWGVAYKDSWLHYPSVHGNTNTRIVVLEQMLDYFNRAEKRFTQYGKAVHLTMLYRNLAYIGNDYTETYFFDTRGDKPTEEQVKKVKSMINLDSIEAYFHRSVLYSLDSSYHRLAFGEYPDFSDLNLKLSPLYCIFNLHGWVDLLFLRIQNGDPGAKERMFKIFAWQEQLLKRAFVEQQDLQMLYERMSIVNGAQAYGYLLLYTLDQSQSAYLDSALHHLEMVESLQTRRGLQQEELMRQAGIPQPEIEHYQDLKKRLSEVSFKEGLTRRERKITLADSLLRAKIALLTEGQQLEVQLSKQYPAYDLSMSGSPRWNLARLRKLMPERSLVILKTKANASHFMLHISKDKVNVFRHQNYPVRGFNDSLARGYALPDEDLNKQKQQKASFVKAAHGLYNFYFNGGPDYFKKENLDHIIAVGGYPLLEVLLLKPATTETPYRNMDFLVRHAAVQYIPSLTIWEMAKQGGQARSQGKVLAFAPSYDSSYINPTRSAKIRNMRKGLSPLAGATKEVEQLKNRYSGDYFLGLEATETSLKKQLQSGKYAVMHLAMHGLLDEKNTENSALALTETPQDSSEDNFLYGAEIALLKAKAQLVVLSACETGTGKIVGGEGQLSLARYFLRAGVPSLIATRWQINDQATAILIQHFYQELDKGKNIAQSLRQAQLSYLNEVEDLAAHPYFWAAFFNTGYTDQLITLSDKNAQNHTWLYALGLSLLGLLGLAWWWRGRARG